MYYPVIVSVFPIALRNVDEQVEAFTSLVQVVQELSSRIALSSPSDDLLELVESKCGISEDGGSWQTSDML